MIDQYFQRYASQMAVTGRKGQERLRQARVHIAGFGGLGNTLAVLLAASGVGQISANDPQKLEIDNLGRFFCGSKVDLGRPKVEAAARFFHNWPDLVFEPLVAPSESAAVDPLLAQVDWVICASNTLSSRLSCARKALRLGKPLLDVAVADGRHSLAGIIKFKLPDCPRSACPACYFEPGLRFERNEGLLLTVISVTAALAAHTVLQFIAEKESYRLREANFFMVELRPPYHIETLAVAKRDGCPACGQMRFAKPQR